MLRRARHAAAAAMCIGEGPAAIALADAAARIDPLDEIAHRLLMRAHVAAGQMASAGRAYERLRTTLAEELGIDPAPETRGIHVEIVRRTPDDAGASAACLTA